MDVNPVFYVSFSYINDGIFNANALMMVLYGYTTELDDIFYELMYYTKYKLSWIPLLIYPKLAIFFNIDFWCSTLEISS